MMNKRTFYRAGTLALLAMIALTGCKLEVRVPPGGSVMTADGSFNCNGGQTCVIDVVDIFFDQTFVAMAAQGYRFDGWKAREGNLCGGQQGYCTLSTAEFEGHPELMAILESSESFRLEPHFVWNPMPANPELVISPDPGTVD